MLDDVRLTVCMVQTRKTDNQVSTFQVIININLPIYKRPDLSGHLNLK